MEKRLSQTQEKKVRYADKGAYSSNRLGDLAQRNLEAFSKGVNTTTFQPSAT